MGCNDTYTIHIFREMTCTAFIYIVDLGFVIYNLKRIYIVSVWKMICFQAYNIIFYIKIFLRVIPVYPVLVSAWRLYSKVMPRSHMVGTRCNLSQWHILFSWLSKYLKEK